MSMEKFLKMFQSKTVWTIAAIFLFNGLTAIHSMVGGDTAFVINGILSALAIYFKLNPSQTY